MVTMGLFFVTGCKKQKKCEDCKEQRIGMFQYLEEPIYYEPYCQFKAEKVVAMLYLNTDTEQIDYNDGMYITGTIPEEYKSGDLIKVRACLEDTYKNDIVQCPCVGVYKLKCIEMED
jgi:hypothetical protein